MYKIFVIFLGVLYNIDRCVFSEELKLTMETKFIDVPLDHFTPANTGMFSLRYLLSSNFHTNEGAVFVYTGGEGDICVHAQNTGFIFQIAPTFNALLVFIEHRYYGMSLPFGNQSFSSPENLRYLTTTQALADFAYVIEYLKKQHFGNVVTFDTLPFVAFGGSYSGMLAAYLRMKYPYTVVGAVASSAPLFYLPGLTSCESFYEKVTEVFRKDGGEDCIRSIELGWGVITNLLKSQQGMDYITSTWKLCDTIRRIEDTEIFLSWLSNIYVNLALVNYHYPASFYVPLPAYPVKVFCDKLTSSHSNDTRSFIKHFGWALELYTNYTGRTTCVNPFSADFTEYAWNYQTCTEIIMPKCSTENDMFLTKPWDYEKYARECYAKYGVKSEEPDWAVLAYGGKNLKYYSNILFTNALMDPYSCGGVFEHFSNSVFYVNITDAPRQVDLRAYDAADNNYVTEVRELIVQTLKEWLTIPF